MTVRVVFADDNYLVREGVAGLLAETAGSIWSRRWPTPTRCTARWPCTGPTRCSPTSGCRPTFTTEGIDAAKRIRAEFPGTGVVVLSQYVEEDYAFELLSDGVEGLGYLLKERVSQVDDLVRALHDVSRGWLGSRPQGGRGTPGPQETGDRARRCAVSPSASWRCSRRWRPVAATRPTAKALFMSERAVEKHVGSVFQKLGLANESDVNRRVMAVLAYLEATGGATPVERLPTRRCAANPLPPCARSGDDGVEEVLP